MLFTFILAVFVANVYGAALSTQRESEVCFCLGKFLLFFCVSIKCGYVTDFKQKHKSVSVVLLN